jgi:hypothetical protein
MKVKRKLYSAILVVSITIGACSKENTTTNDSGNLQNEKVGFELVEIESYSEILVWTNDEPMTMSQFDSIQIPSNWRKNEPREGDPDESKFLRSPDAAADGVFTRDEHFGYNWLFNAQIVEQNVSLPDNADGLLTGRTIAKFHQVMFKSGRTLHVLISPDGQEYVRISRDANRASDFPQIPSEWKIEERVISEDLILDLPNPTLNIRAENNQDSFQGPVDI